MISPRRLLTSLIVASFAAIAACGGDLSGPDRERSELDINRDKWREHGYRDYSVTMTRLCFCGEVGPFAVTVLSDSVVAAVRTSDGAPSLVAAYLPTVNKLFDFIQRAIDEHAVTIRVTYDAQLGYPREIVYDLASNIADEEVTYSLSGVARISTTQRNRR
jgi:Family of unknown function (DUF6174)